MKWEKNWIKTILPDSSSAIFPPRFNLLLSQVSAPGFPRLLLKMLLPETTPKALDPPQGEELDGLQNPLGNQEGTVMLEGEVHKDSVVGIPVVDHNYIGHPARKTKIHMKALIPLNI